VPCFLRSVACLVCLDIVRAHNPSPFSYAVVWMDSLQMALERSSSLLTEFMTANARLKADFKTVDEYVALASALQDVQV
jgi:hypothetical protein